MSNRTPNTDRYKSRETAMFVNEHLSRRLKVRTYSALMTHLASEQLSVDALISMAASNELVGFIRGFGRVSANDLRSVLIDIGKIEKQFDTDTKARLIEFDGEIDKTTMSDVLLITARNIEDAFLSAGANPVQDYNYVDLFTLALPFVLESWKVSDGQLTLTV
jgi:hypothetical protein